MTERTVAHYRLEEKLGEGGMGVVYRAFDTHLDRTVAIKLLRPEAVGDPERKWRFVREAKAASSLNHPNIVTIHDIDTKDGVDFIAMEHVKGLPLDREIAGRRLPLEEALQYAVQIASALSAAHAAGIVHRDLKPANIMVEPEGRIKVLDFGLAKLLEHVEVDEAASTTPAGSSLPPQTRGGVVLGTLSYMSPEQAEGKPLDVRTDVFSFGAVLYEMLAGRRPFQGDSQLSTLTAILRDSPPPLKSLRPGVPADLERILRRCLEKNRDARYASGAELGKELRDCQARLAPGRADLRSLLRRPRLTIPALLVLLAILAGAVFLWRRESRARWARGVALPEVARLLEKEDFTGAFRLAREAERNIPEDRELRRLLTNATLPFSIETIPPGAEVFFGDYLLPDSGWERAGQTPIENVRLPAGYKRWRVSKEGFETAEGAPVGTLEESIRIRFTLQPRGAAPRGMIFVPRGPFPLWNSPPVELGDYWLDKHEVTNAQFKEFVDRGGYQRREFWKQPFLADGRPLSWEQALARFRDTTGRPGPATWELGAFPEGHADFPVSGVSWYEAAAYAEFAGKSLPTVYHWYRAAEPAVFSEILRLSNFSGEGLARAGAYRGLGPYGTYDTAGNVKEWCWNEANGRRYLLGGSWSEPSYVYGAPDLAPPMERAQTHGFRCARYAAPLPAALTAPLERARRDYAKERPASDEAFRIYAGLYTYDRTALDARTERVEDSPGWRRERLTFNAAYGGERVIANLYLPKNADPPYQTVIYFPDSTAEAFRSSEEVETRWFDFVVRSGRALLFPVYKGTYERRGDASSSGVAGPRARRDLVIQWSKDLGRSIDYLATRKDIDSERLAFYGFSLGAVYGPVFTAVEGRLRASVWLGGGLPMRTLPPEIDAIHFAPRVRAPVLMVNGRQDFIRPVEVSQIPLFRFLGTPEKDKRHVLLEGGHLPPKIQPAIREILDWLDRYLGPVKIRA